MTQLIICEKPQASLRIAEALTDGEITKKVYKKVSYYEITRNKKKILVGCAVGHLYNLTEKEKKGWVYPTFELKWAPSFQLSKTAAFTKNYLDVLKSLAKKADDFIIACDYDTEGSLIGYNALRFIFNKKDAKRMKFSNLTKEELINSYENASKHLDFPLIESGETRHILDHFYGINTSRALTLSVKAAGSFKVLSSGRVQSPTLYWLSKKEKEIKNFKPTPFYQLLAQIKVAKYLITTIHKKGKFTNKPEIQKILKKCSNKDANLIKLDKKEVFIEPLPPFNITSLQIESYRKFGYSPKQTLDIAQKLYLQAYISYPRTSSEQLDPKIDYKKILKLLKDYKDLVKKIKALNPKQGKKTDPAHIAIYPTSSPPKLNKLDVHQKRIYDLIVRRFIAAFSEPVLREIMDLEFEINGESFLAKGARTIKQGWASIYPTKFKELTFPPLKKGKYKIKKLEIKEDQTKSPKRYSQGSVISEMEKHGLGTKATRHAILQVLYDRHYIDERSIKVTKLGMAVAETLEKYVPELTSEKLTKHFETELEKIQLEKKKQKTILDEAKRFLIKVLEKFKKNEKKIGLSLLEATREARRVATTIGKCDCGGNLVIKRSKYGMFIACDRYPKCKFTHSLPQGLIKPTGKVCKFCNKPVILVVRSGKRPFEMCLTYDCKSKANWKKTNQKKS